MGENIKLRYHFHLQKVGRQYLAITTGEEARQYPGVLYFNETGAEICAMLQEDACAENGQGTTVGAVLDRLCNTYDAPREELRQCLEEVLQYLRQAGVLTEA